MKNCRCLFGHFLRASRGQQEMHLLADIINAVSRQCFPKKLLLGYTFPAQDGKRPVRKSKLQK